MLSLSISPSTKQIVSAPAMSSLASTAGQPAEHRVRRSLECAELLNGGVRAPFRIEYLDAEEENLTLPLLSAVA